MVKLHVLLDGNNMEATVISSVQFLTLVVDLALGCNAIIIVLHHLIRVQRCFASVMRLKILG